MFEELKKNIEQEKKIINEINLIKSQLNTLSEEKKKLYASYLLGLTNQLKIINEAIPALLGEKSNTENFVSLSYNSPADNQNHFVTIGKNDKEHFISELNLSESSLKNIKKSINELKPISKKPSKIARVSSIVFSGISDKIAGNFDDVKQDLRKANISLTISTYISIALFCSFCILFVSLIIFGALALFIQGFIKWIWVPFVIFILSLVSFYFYPATEKGSLEKRISGELPFATIYMAAIAGSNLEPTKIFNIIAESREYPSVGYEMKKLINQINLYGYDLVTALKNTADKTPNKKFSELLSGLATNVVSGGSLKAYLEKKSENFLLDYRLERQRYTSLAETMMDIYIAILLAGPLVLMIMLVIMNATKMSIGMPLSSLLIIIVAVIVFVNILFLIIVHFKQPQA
ncbi:MAG: type II secretion system F family protein [Nanoarchaeota archaeon]